MRLDRYEIPAVINVRPVGTPTTLLYLCDTLADSSDLTESRLSIVSLCTTEMLPTSPHRIPPEPGVGAIVFRPHVGKRPLEAAKASSTRNGPCHRHTSSAVEC